MWLQPSMAWPHLLSYYLNWTCCVWYPPSHTGTSVTDSWWTNFLSSGRWRDARLPPVWEHIDCIHKQAWRSQLNFMHLELKCVWILAYISSSPWAPHRKEGKASLPKHEPPMWAQCSLLCPCWQCKWLRTVKQIWLAAEKHRSLNNTVLLTRGWQCGRWLSQEDSQKERNKHTHHASCSRHTYRQTQRWKMYLSKGAKWNSTWVQKTK